MSSRIRRTNSRRRVARRIAKFARIPVHLVLSAPWEQHSVLAAICRLRSAFERSRRGRRVLARFQSDLKSMTRLTSGGGSR